MSTIADGRIRLCAVELRSFSEALERRGGASRMPSEFDSSMVEVSFYAVIRTVSGQVVILGMLMHAKLDSHRTPLRELSAAMFNIMVRTATETIF